MTTSWCSCSWESSSIPLSLSHIFIFISCEETDHEVRKGRARKYIKDLLYDSQTKEGKGESEGKRERGFWFVMSCMQNGVAGEMRHQQQKIQFSPVSSFWLRTCIIIKILLFSTLCFDSHERETQNLITMMITYPFSSHFTILSHSVQLTGGTAASSPLPCSAQPVMPSPDHLPPFPTISLISLVVLLSFNKKKRRKAILELREAAHHHDCCRHRHCHDQIIGRDEAGR